MSKGEKEYRAELAEIAEELRKLRNRSSQIVGELDEIVSGHRSIQASDPQYDDPELWWSVDLLEAASCADDLLEDILLERTFIEL